MALSFVRYVPAGVEGLTAGINFMDDLRTKGEAIETAATARQIEEETARRQKALLDQPLTGLGYSPQAGLFVPNTMPKLGDVKGTVPAYTAPAGTKLPLTPAAETAPAPAAAPAVTPPLQPGQTLGPRTEQEAIRTQVDFNKSYDGIIRGWAEGSYQNPAISGIMAVPATSDLAKRPDYLNSREVYLWSTKPETKAFFASNPTAFQEFGANPAAAYGKYKDLKPVATEPAAPAPGTQPAAPAPAPAAPGTGERVAGQGVEVPAGQPLQVTVSKQVPGVGPAPEVLKTSERFIRNKAAVIEQFPQLLQNPKLGAVVRDANRIGVPVPAAIATFAIESEFGRRAGVSSAGAVGGWQVTPETRDSMVNFFSDVKGLQSRGVTDAANLAQVASEIRQLEADGKTEDANRLTGLLRLRYNDVIGVPVELWGAAYQANAEKVKANGAPLNVDDGLVLNEAYNTVYVAAYNAAQDYISSTNLVGGEQVVGELPSGQKAGVVPPKLEGYTGKPAETTTLEIRRLGDLRTQTVAAAQSQRQQLDNTFNREMQSAELQRRTLQARLDAARSVGNAKAVESAMNALTEFDGKISAFVQKYQTAATGIQTQLNAAVYKADGEMTSLMVDTAVYNFQTQNNTDGFVQMYQAITGADMQLQEAGTDKSGQSLYNVYLPDPKTGEMKLFQKSVSSQTLSTSLKSLSDSKAAATIAAAEADAAKEARKFTYDVGVKQAEGQNAIALEVVKGKNQINLKKLEQVIPNVQKFGDNGAIWTEVGPDNTVRTYVALPQVNPTTNQVEPVVQEVNPAQFNRSAGVQIPSAQ